MWDILEQHVVTQQESLLHGAGDDSSSPYHISKRRDEEEEDGEDTNQCAVCTWLDYFLGYSLQGDREELEKRQQGQDQIRES